MLNKVQLGSSQDTINNQSFHQMGLLVRHLLFNRQDRPTSPLSYSLATSSILPGPCWVVLVYLDSILQSEEELIKYYMGSTMLLERCCHLASDPPTHTECLDKPRILRQWNRWLANLKVRYHVQYFFLPRLAMVSLVGGFTILLVTFSFDTVGS